ncbi:kinase-like domain-containing protein, partial [Lophiotrema nucula]
FVRAQSTVLTPSLEIEMGEKGAHCYLENDKPVSFQRVTILGSGGFGEVDKYMGLLMTPIADMDLSTYLADAGPSNRAELRTFFGCLAQGLKFLHERNVRHKDIKPSNVLIHQGSVLFTDFGLSFDFSEACHSTTISIVNGMTPRYCAPEVAESEPRNTSSDIWSLGIVFLEMLVVLKSHTVESMREYFRERGTE